MPALSSLNCAKFLGHIILLRLQHLGYVRAIDCCEGQGLDLELIADKYNRLDD